MPDLEPAAGSLAGLRVVEVAGQFGRYTGKLFADFGAEVILVEPLGGSAARWRPPFIGDRPGPDRSLDFSYFNTNKRSLTLDLDTADGQALFRALAATAHAVIESEPIGSQARRRLDHSALSADRPELVVTSITPYGSTGPSAGLRATDLTLMAAGGLLARGGYRDASPVRAGGDQAVLAADQFAAVATMMAILDAESTGTGQWVDVSAQASVLMAHENAIQFFDLEGTARTRDGIGQRQAGVGVYTCQDGLVYLLANGLGPFWNELVAWLERSGVDGVDGLRDPQWQDDDFAKTADAKQHFEGIFESFSSKKTKAELYAEALEHGIPLAPINDPADVAGDPHLLERDYFAAFPHPLLDRPAMMPGAPFKSTASVWSIRSAAPSPGADNEAILEELGMSRQDRILLRSEGAA